MSRRKRRVSARFSLFAFQDIITCVMGIMLLLTLLLCLQITESVSQAADTDAPERVREIGDTVHQLMTELDQLEQQTQNQAQLLTSGALSDRDLLLDEQREQSAERRVAEQELIELDGNANESAERLEELASKSSAELAAMSEEITRQLARARQQNEIAQQLTDGSRVLYTQHSGSSSVCWVVEVSSDSSIQAAPIGKSQPPQSFATINAALQWIRGQHRNGDEFLLLLKPDSRDAIDRLPGTLREEQIPHAFDVIAQDQTALDPTTGAAAL